jgi:hypothetical protein
MLLQSNEDPMNALANLLDLMLVFACGLIVALVMSWNMQSVLFKDISPEKRQQIIKAIQSMVEVDQGKELESLPDAGQAGQSGSGLQEMGRVYQDPQTGKLIMIKP